MTGYTRTALLLAAMTGLFMAVGYMLGGQSGMITALMIAAGINFFSYWFSDKIVLSMHGAREVDASTAPDLYHMVADLARRADMPMPKVYIMDTDQPNAFATGRDPAHGAVAATTGLLRRLSPEEIAGVMAHELAHIKNRDTLIMTITATIAGAISMLGNFAFMFSGGHRQEGEEQSPPNPIIGIVLMIVAPLAAMIVQMAISRAREYEADRIGAEICGQPEALASALQNIQHQASHIDNWQAENNPAAAHMFIINPLHARTIGGLFRTHPATEDRVARLMAMVGTVSQKVSGTMRRTSRGPSAGQRAVD